MKKGLKEPFLGLIHIFPVSLDKCWWVNLNGAQKGSLGHKRVHWSSPILTKANRDSLGLTNKIFLFKSTWHQSIATSLIAESV